MCVCVGGSDVRATCEHAGAQLLNPVRTSRTGRDSENPSLQAYRVFLSVRDCMYTSRISLQDSELAKGIGLDPTARSKLHVPGGMCSLKNTGGNTGVRRAGMLALRNEIRGSGAGMLDPRGECRIVGMGYWGERAGMLGFRGGMWG